MASHDERIRGAVSAFEESTARLIAILEGVNDEVATRAPNDGGWTAAQVGWHVGTTNEWMSGAVSGAVPMAKPAPAGFVENPLVFSNVPPKLKTFPSLEPPASVTRQDAIAKLRGAAPSTVNAFQTLTQDRAAANVLEFPFGAISLYQGCDFTVAHVDRHIAQVKRVIGES